MSATQRLHIRQQSLKALALGALGVVYGDIGTSPLYAIKECFNPHVNGLKPNELNVLGILSLVCWSLVLGIVFKYLSFIMRADNEGEGGVLALLALAIPPGRSRRPSRRTAVLSGLGLFGAALLYGDGVITPAISVLSAIEGIDVATPVFSHYVMPLTVVILVALFWVQKRGTGDLGRLFGVATFLWFISIAGVAIPWIFREPGVLRAVNPYYAYSLLAREGLRGYLVLGAVVLCITGGEALYADMGHFGKRPIRVAWYAVVMPALLINYFGQGAVLLAKGAGALKNPFYALVPNALLWPMVVIATIAAVVASQALITGVFSMTRQAVQLGYLPRLNIVHTSAKHEGQIYMPDINKFLAVACCALVVGFRESSRLAAAYGIAVTGTMTITTILFFVVMRRRWGTPRTALLTLAFLTFDVAFLGANLGKLDDGGYFSVVVAVVMFFVMSTWRMGTRALGAELAARREPLETFIDHLKAQGIVRVPGTGVFMTSDPEGTPPLMIHHVKHNKVLHEQVVLLSVATARVPRVSASKRVEIESLGFGFFRVKATYGFMQNPDVSDIALRCTVSGLETVENETTFYLGHDTLLPSGRSKLSSWRKALFAFLNRNARSATTYYRVPPQRVLEIGMRIEL